MEKNEKQRIEGFAKQIRAATVDMIAHLGAAGHVGGALSMVDLLAVLYGSIMHIQPDNPHWENRDRFVCSKGHAGPGLYATLALKGFFPYEQLYTLNRPGTMLPSHCDGKRTPGVDMTTGSLGQGSSLAVGLALGERLRKRSSRIYLLTGDGEMDEGQVWEAAMFASHMGLSNLTWFVDENKKQLDGYTSSVLSLGNLKDKFDAFGFHAQRVNGNDVEAIFDAIAVAKQITDRPQAIILDTTKGAGIPDIEQMMFNHSMPITRDQADRWIAWLKEGIS